MSRMGMGRQDGTHLDQRIHCSVQHDVAAADANLPRILTACVSRPLHSTRQRDDRFFRHAIPASRRRSVLFPRLILHNTYWFYARHHAMAAAQFMAAAPLLTALVSLTSVAVLPAEFDSPTSTALLLRRPFINPSARPYRRHPPHRIPHIVRY